METKLLTTKVKVKSCVFILYLCCQQYFLETKASIKKSDVAKYLIERELGSSQDTFSVLFKQGCEQNRCNPTCADLLAYDVGITRKNFNRTCSCKYANRTFLPERGKCLSDNQAANNLTGPQTLSVMGCSNILLSWDDLFLNGFNLKTSDTGSHYISEKFQSCGVIPRSSMYYDSLEQRWKSIFSEIFTVTFNITYGIILKWEADINNTLSGRILRLNVTCNYTSGTNNLPLNGCLLIKAVGAVTYNYENQDSECPSSTISSLVPTVSPLYLSTSVVSISPSSLPVSSILPSLPSSSLSSPSSVITTIITTTAQVSLKTPTASLASVESQNSLADSSLQNTAVSKTIVKLAIKTNALSVNPSKPSLTTKAASSSAVIDRPGNKKARVNGNDNGVVIGAVVGGAGVCVIIIIIIIIVFCKRRNLWRNKEKTTKLQGNTDLVKNPVYGSSDIPLSLATENQVTTSMDQDSQPTYQDLVTDNGKISGAAIYSNPDDNDYDNYNAYQSLDKKVPGSPVYQSLTKGPLGIGKPTPKSNPGVTGPPSERPKITEEPVYNVIEQPDTDQATIPVKVNGPQDHDSQGGAQDPVYNVLDDTEENYEVPDVGDSLYNVLEGPESEQDPQEPLYNVVESSDAEKSSHQGAQDSHGFSNEPLYNVVEGPGSDGPNKNGLGYNAPNGSTSQDAHDNPAYEESPDFGPNKNGVCSDALKGSSSPDAYGNPSYEGSLDFGPDKNGVGFNAPNGSSPPDAHDNPAYEQNLDFDVPYASVHRPGSQTESVYEPLKGPNDQNLYKLLK